MKPTPTYRTWTSMWTRCTNPKSNRWSSYGGRGIKICLRWKKFVNFLLDMGPRPASTCIERIDNNKNYEPGNCRWATKAEQNRNYSRNHFVTIDGKTKCLIEWVEEKSITTQTFYRRVKSGMSEQEAILAPSLPNKNLSHCFKGHPFDESNTIIRPNGYRACRECHLIGRRRRYSKNKDQGKVITV